MRRKIPGGGSSGNPSPRVPISSGVFGDNFVRANGVPGNNWTDVQTGVWDINTNVLRVTNSAPIGTAYLRDHLIRQASENAVEQRVEFVCTGSATGTISAAALLRYQTSTKDHYLVSINGNAGGLRVAIYTIVGGAVGTLVAPRLCNVSSPVWTGLDIRVIAEATGTSPTRINLRVYNDSTGALLDSTTLTNSSATLQVAGSSGISAWDVAAVGNLVFKEFQSLTLPTNNINIVFEGDSITRGEQATSGLGTVEGSVYPSVTMRAIGREATGTNLGSSGQSASSMQSNAATRAAANFAAGKTNVVVLMGGTNDIGTGGATAQNVYDRVSAACATWKAAGYKVVICTLLPASHPVYASTFNATRSAANALIRAGWRGFADNICDVGGHSLIGENGSDTKRNFFASAERTHPVDGGYRIMGEMVAEAINRIIAKLLPLKLSALLNRRAFFFYA